MCVACVQKNKTASLIQSPSSFDPIQKIALPFFKELAICFGCNALVSIFVATPPGISIMVSTSLVQSVVSLFFHSASAFNSGKISSLCDWIKSANFVIFTGYNVQNLLHEIGHALSALTVYQNSRPTIELYPFTGGLTQFYKTKLSFIGNQIGPSAAACLVAASGPGLTLLISSALLWVGLGMKKTNPKLSQYLISWSLFDFFHHAHYAFSALHAKAWNLSHDFVHLSLFGVNPIAACIGIIAIPIVIFLGSQNSNMA